MVARIITSRENTFFKELKRLIGNAKAQTADRLALLDGIHLVQACITARVPIRHILLTKDAQSNSEVKELQRAMNPELVTLISGALFRDLTSVATPVGIAAVIEVPNGLSPATVVASDTLVLDGIQDAGNVGTMLRTAACVGLKNIVLGKGCAGAWTPKVLRAAQGAHFVLDIAEQVDLLGWLLNQSLPSIGADVASSSCLYDFDLRAPKLWVFGSEGQGLSDAVKGQLTQTLSIPMDSGMESLNVSSAAAICLYEARRQRMVR